MIDWVDKRFPQRKQNRLQGYDYSQNGAYFITICVKDKHEILSTIDVGARIARPTEIGEKVESAMQQIGEKYPTVTLDKYVIMPNHIHMILMIKPMYIDGRAMRAPTISTVINQFKGFITKQIGESIWQKLFHDRIIRTEEEYIKICKYIQENPQTWLQDCYYE
jgi:REP element-mobilizing transposase RayT